MHAHWFPAIDHEQQNCLISQLAPASSHLKVALASATLLMGPMPSAPPVLAYTAVAEVHTQHDEQGQTTGPRCTHSRAPSTWPPVPRFSIPRASQPQSLAAWPVTHNPC